MERQASAMETLAQLLLGQVQRQRREIATLKAAMQKERVEAPSLATMLRTAPR